VYSSFVSRPDSGGSGSRARRFTRRSVLGSGLAGAAVLAVGVPGAAATGVTLTSADEELLVHIAGTIAVLPVPFPAFGEQGTAGSRATTGRLRSSLGRLPGAGHAAVADGLRVIRPVVSTGDDHETVVRRFGELVAGNQAVDGLVAVVAVCVATLAAKFDPASRSAAELWLDYARRFAAITGGGR
jgi:hypothetical protein